jgi:hypothetical protein
MITPEQKADLIENELEQVAEYRGLDPDTVLNAEALRKQARKA